MATRVDVSEELQVAYPDVFGQPRTVRFMGDLLQTLGTWGAIGPAMAARLVGWQWPPLRAPKDAAWKWLYIARSDASGSVKIGISSNPLERAKSLSSDYGFQGPWQVVAVVPRCGTEHEKALYDLFRDSLLIGSEWFKNTLATRILCWVAARQRNQRAFDAEVERFGEKLTDAFGALAWLSGGRPVGWAAYLVRRREDQRRRAEAARRGHSRKVA